MSLGNGCLQLRHEERKEGNSLVGGTNVIPGGYGFLKNNKNLPNTLH